MHSGDTAITVENLAKLYRIGTKQKSRDSLGQVVVDLIKSPFQNYHKYRSLYVFKDMDTTNHGNATDTIWALRDVAFQVKRGEALGIIGRNGAGKSTLLKILSRITSPTLGRVEIRGRISSLLEVGTGFHNELTGRENIYLNGTILGMKKAEVDAKFDAIVDFSGVERFLDTPVKRYSSGMKVRLAFAVAAHLEPDILIIDEVLAVGDAAFQRKCLSKMEDIEQAGQTILFVSHNMAAITRLCPRAILLDEGKMVNEGESQKIVGAYLDSGQWTRAVREWPDPATAPRGEVARLRAVRVISRDGQIAEAVNIREGVGIQMEYDVTKRGFVLLPHFYFYNEQGINIFGTLDQDLTWRGRRRPEGRYRSTVWIPGNFLAEGRVFVNCNLITTEPEILQFHEPQAVVFQVIDAANSDSARGDWRGKMLGVVRPLFEWTTDFNAASTKSRATN
jgi:lipopolysaccharide transport system ATP-binding protein